MQNLIVNDQEFVGYAESIEHLNLAMENTFASVIKQLRIVCCDGVTEGDFHDNLLAFIESLEMMQGQMQYFTNAMKKMANEFVAEIDEIDGDIY